jgi:hypothetical protein
VNAFLASLWLLLRITIRDALGRDATDLHHRLARAWMDPEDAENWIAAHQRGEVGDDTCCDSDGGCAHDQATTRRFTDLRRGVTR